MHDLVGAFDDVFQRGFADFAAVIGINIAQVDVEANQVTTFTWDQQDGATVVGVDRALGANIREIGFDQHVHEDRKSTRLNSSHVSISYAVFCLKKKQTIDDPAVTY